MEPGAAGHGQNVTGSGIEHHHRPAANTPVHDPFNFALQLQVQCKKHIFRGRRRLFFAVAQPGNQPHPPVNYRSDNFLLPQREGPVKGELNTADPFPFTLVDITNHVSSEGLRPVALLPDSSN